MFALLSGLPRKPLDSLLILLKSQSIIEDIREIVNIFEKIEKRLNMSRAKVLRNIRTIVGNSDKESNVKERIVFCIECGLQVFDTQPGQPIRCPNSKCGLYRLSKK